MKSIVRNGAEAFEASVVGAVVTGDKVLLVLSWGGSKEATLVELRDNSQHIPIVQTVGRGRLEIEFQSGGTGTHYVEVQLEFPSRTLKKLKLEVQLNGGALRSVDEADERDAFWHAEGVAF